MTSITEFTNSYCFDYKYQETVANSTPTPVCNLKYGNDYINDFLRSDLIDCCGCK